MRAAIYSWQNPCGLVLVANTCTSSVTRRPGDVRGPAEGIGNVQETVRKLVSSYWPSDALVFVVEGHQIAVSIADGCDEAAEDLIRPSVGIIQMRTVLRSAKVFGVPIPQLRHRKPLSLR